jgi:hypothetical protein
MKIGAPSENIDDGSKPGDGHRDHDEYEEQQLAERELGHG